MADLIFVLLTVAFFALMAALVAGFDRLLGPGEAEAGAGVAEEECAVLAAAGGER